jgi:hypothetical protein
MIRLIRLHGKEVPTTVDATSLADELLNSFGWRQLDEVLEKPLASCIRIADNDAFSLADTFSGNSLRIVLESFCKDVLDVVVTQLGYNHKQLWDAIDERIPSYRSSSKHKDWNEEMRHLTIGGAVILLPALGALAFPTRAKEGEQIAAGLRELLGVLNMASHHQEEMSPSLTEVDRIPGLIHQILNKAKEFLGELPWHLHASSIYGEQPKILSGQAWSHGSATPRLLRVILWTGTIPGHQVLIWSKTRRNPIITDPVFIQRPQRV